MSHIYRFYAQPEENDASRVILRDDEAHHALHVIRIKVGQEIDIFDGNGHTWRCCVEETSRKEVSCSVLEQRHVSADAPRVILSLAWLNKDKAVESLIQRCTELGVGEFRFFRGDHSGRAPKHSAKWNKWAVESCKQCGRVWLPTFTLADTLADTLKPNECTLIASLEEDSIPLSDCVNTTKDINILIGPEGDFSEAEYAQLSAHDAQSVSLGEATYRSEVAAGVMSALVMYELGRLG